ncbi:MAG: DUF4142 domain-containing protein [Gemmataceae bacterium]|nr:DUF4142 domain-containing protein [Gemmataceae bacterium]
MRLLIALLIVSPLLAADDDKKTADQDFVLKASAGGLAEVNHGMLAKKQAGSEDVRKFAEHMIMDHEKANKELIALADKKRLKVAERMPPDAVKMADMLAKMKGEEFDKAYMEGQVKDHEETVALFEKQAKDGEDADLKKWAAEKLPTLKEHLEMARKTRKAVGGK